MTESQELVIAPASATSEESRSVMFDVHEGRQERSGEFATIGPISVSFKVIPRDSMLPACLFRYSASSLFISHIEKTIRYI